MEAVAEKKHDESLPFRYKTLASLLREGSQNAITSTDIMKLSGIDSKRDVMEIIEQLIMKYGYCIGTSRRGPNKGYYLITDPDELSKTLRTYNNQIQSMLKRHKQLQKNFIDKDQLEMSV